MKHREKRKNSQPITKREKMIKRICAIVLSIFLISAIFTVFDIVQLTFENMRLQDEKEANESLLNQSEEELKNVNSDAYIEERARKQFNMINPGEKLYIIEEEAVENLEEQAEEEDVESNN